MRAWLLDPGLYLLGVALVPLVGLLLICWGLWGGRSKGRPRCPKCWYDMRGTVPRLECPECGHAPGSERGLHRTRRGRRRIVVGLVLVLLSVYPLTIVGGWCREQSILRAFHLPQEPPWFPRVLLEDERIGPDWLVSRLPDGFARFFYRRIHASASDKELALCGKLRHLQIVYVSGDVTDAGLEHLEGLSQLQELGVKNATESAEALVGKVTRALPQIRVVHYIETDSDMGSLSVYTRSFRLTRAAGKTDWNSLTMSAWFLETGLYLLGVALVPLVGLLLVARGLWGDRSKGRPRCPKCWYDMRGTVPRLECPECGHAPGSERGLYRNRRGRWRIVLGTMLVLLSAYPLAVVAAWCRDQSSMSRLMPYGADFSTERTGPAWLTTRLPVGFARLFDRVTNVDIGASGVPDMPPTDADLAECGKLRHLRQLYVYGGPEVTDLGLAHLEGLAQLEYVMLYRTQVTDAGLARLSRALPNADVHTSTDTRYPSEVRSPSPRLHWLPPGLSGVKPDLPVRSYPWEDEDDIDFE